jgi:hypothetical protein
MKSSTTGTKGEDLLSGQKARRHPNGVLDRQNYNEGI